MSLQYKLTLVYMAHDDEQVTVMTRTVAAVSLDDATGYALTLYPEASSITVELQ
jgi:hypothetical protein